MNASEHSPQLILLMGVAGSGKTTLGKLLAAHLAWTFVDADDFHSPEAIARMRGGAPLSDDMRDAWVDRIDAALRDLQRQRRNCVLAFSGLRARHRRQLMQSGFANSAFMLCGTEPLLSERLAQRVDHFMPAAQLPDQLESLERIQPDERIEPVDIGALPGAIVAALAAKVMQ